jgi:hypothetical protein
MVTGTGGITCQNCGQHNTGDGQFCVRCGDRLPEPGSTAAGDTGEHPWEPPAEWTPDPQWDNAGGTPNQSWDEQSRTWGSSGAYTPPPSGFPQGGAQQGTYQQQGAFQQQGTFQQPGTQQQGGFAQQSGYPHQGTPPPGYQPPSGPAAGGSGAGSPARRSRTPLFAGLGALIVVALVILGIALVAGSGGNDGASDPDSSAVALNGEEGKTPEQVLDDARVNLRTTTGVHAAGNVTSDGQNIRLDLDFAGNAVKGILTIEGNDVQIIKIGDEVYLKGDRDFYLSVANGDEAAVDAIGNKWLKATGEDAQDFNEFTLDGFADAFKVNDDDSKLNPTVGRESFMGQPAVVLTQADGSRLFVANTGKAYPLRIENKNSADAGQIDFTKYDQPVEISAPSSSDVLDLSEVG